MISAAEAKPDKLFYIVAGVVIVNVVDKTCLLLKRSDTEKVLPGKWSFPGGKLEHRDVTDMIVEAGVDPIKGVDGVLAKLAQREAKEECGLDVVAADDIIVKNNVFIRPDGVPVMLVILAAKYQGGEVVLEDGAFSDFAWVSESEIYQYDCIDGIAQEAEASLRYFAAD